jgi:hypothetical protein
MTADDLAPQLELMAKKPYITAAFLFSTYGVLIACGLRLCRLYKPFPIDPVDCFFSVHRPAPRLEYVPLLVISPADTCSALGTEAWPAGTPRFPSARLGHPCTDMLPISNEPQTKAKVTRYVTKVPGVLKSNQAIISAFNEYFVGAWGSRP